MASQYEYRLNSQYSTMKMAVPFTPDVVFVYNPSNSWLYLNTSTYAIPTATLYDMSIPPESFVVFVPYTPNTEYGGLLVPPPATPINWDCWIEFRRGEKELDWNAKPGFPVIIPLNPLPNPDVAAFWEYEVSPSSLWAEYIDFTASDGGFIIRSGTPTYIPGDGWESYIPAPPNDNQTLGGIINPFPSPWLAEITAAEIFYTNPNDTGSINAPIIGLATATGNVNDNPANTEIKASNDAGQSGLVTGSGSVVFEYNGTPVRRLTLSYGCAPTTGIQNLITHGIALAGTGTPPGIGEDISGGDVQFTDNSTPVGSIAFWFWDFGDGNTSTDQNPLHTYEFAGVYAVTLCVIGVFGGSDCLSGDVYVNAVPDEVFDFV